MLTPQAAALVPVSPQTLLGDSDTAQARLADLREEVATKLETIGEFKPKDVLQFVRNLAYKNVGGQQLECDCMFCGKHLISTGATKVVDHYKSCAVCVPELRDKCVALRSETEKKRKGKEHALVVKETEVQLQVVKAQKAEKVQQGIRAGFGNAEKDIADLAIAKFFYSNGISFGAADEAVDSFYREMVNAIKATPAGYVPPSKYVLSDRLIDQVYGEAEKAVVKRDAAGNLSNKFGAAYTSDGWDSCDHLPLINSAYILANDSGVYIRSVDTSGCTKNAEYVASLMIVDIYTVGCIKFIVNLSDTCATMRKAWGYVEDEFPWISSLPCQTHCPSLLLNDISKLPQPAQTIKEEGVVVSWFTNHQLPLAILREKVRARLGRSKELKKAGATRMGTNTFVGERLKEVQPDLQATVVDERYVSQNYKDAADDVETGSGGKVTRENKGGTAKKFVLDDGGFWGRVTNHVTLTMPICKFLRRHDSSAPATGKVYHGWFEMGEHVKGSTVPYATKALDKHEERWAYSHCDFYSAAYVLDPEFIDHDHGGNEEVMQGFNNTLEKIAFLLKVRSKADEYKAQWEARKDMIEKDPMAQRKWDSFPSYPDANDADVKEFCAKACTQLSMYKAKKGVFARGWVMDQAKDMPAYLWWDQHGSSTPELQVVGRMVLAQPASASICERINGEFEFVKDRRRNRLSHVKANKLVYLFHNLRMLKKMKKPNYTEPTIGWGDEEDEADRNKARVTQFTPSASAGPSKLLQTSTLSPSAGSSNLQIK